MRNRTFAQKFRGVSTFPIIVAILCLGLWTLLVIAGKGGFVHILLLIGIACVVIEAVTIYRSRLKE